ncbi:MFS transporter [Streptomyces subrutilus]|uniref:MFS transporter n=1 Tax=Streptomyces subrutilus TaxID=36818 RepID=A0A5P2UEY6_9ACTN|nr:MFS transporter [Streptomyces subrutilus]QEU77836.1 MFS transporter [Streptomyces subrutilus]GGZ62647.1 MFS transporter [Streptomyces subrutilus]
MSLLTDIVPPPGIVRTLCLSNLAKTAGHGILMSVSVLFFTRTVGIPAEQVGLALTIGAAVGMAASIPAGRLADVIGPRNTTVGFLLLLGLFVGAYGFVDSFIGLAVATSLALMAESSTDAARGALIAGLIPQKERVRAWSYMRAVSNLGVSLGAAAGAVALWFDNRPAYVGLLIAGGAMFVIAGLAYLTVPQVEPVPREAQGPKWVVLRDLPYATVALLNSVLVMNVAILTVALPIWITTQTSAPKWLYSVILILNTIMVVLFQVRASKGSDEVSGGARTLRRCGMLLAVCCGLFALAAGQPAWLAIVLLLAGAAVHVVGEMFYSAGSWSLAFGLAPDHAQGQYQGMFGMSTQLGSVVTPALATVLIVRLGWPGWLVFAGLLLAAGLAAPAVAAWAERTRQPAPAVAQPA